MPMPGSLSHINLWAVRDDRGWAIFDTGLQTQETCNAWRQLFGEPLGLEPTRVLATHMHPDHIGMAGWITRKFNVPLWMTRGEYLTCRVLVADTGRQAPEEGIGFYRRAGWNADALETYRTRFGNYGKLVYALPESYRRIHAGERIRIGAHEWKVVVGTGHSPEHACFHCEDLKLLISGDQVLPKISSNVSVYPTEPEANPLHEWLGSIEHIKREVPDDVLVLPAHNDPFRGLHARLDHLARGHLNGLDRLRLVLREPRRVVDLFGSLFKREVTSDQFLLGLATGECVANLNYLVQRGEATVTTDADGVAWYRMAGAPAA
jgi:glyoxylase-like metal-dependent hydrolase (beta-lactamase superfamily II)